MSAKPALVVVDFQNDFCSPRGKGASRRGNLARVERAAGNLRRALARARAAKLPVIFVQFLGDRKYQRRNMIARDRRLGKKSKCLEGTWGADFFKVAPLASEIVVKKYACFDAFTNESFEALLKKLRVKRLIMAGVYLDICVDATARTAFQKGYDVTVLTDCAESLHYPKRAVLRFMAHYYGAALETSRGFPLR